MRLIDEILNDIKNESLKDEIQNLVNKMLYRGKLEQCEKCGNIHNLYHICDECGWDKSEGKYFNFKTLMYKE